MTFLPTLRRGSLGGVSVTNASDDDLTPREEIYGHPESTMPRRCSTLLAVSGLILVAVALAVSKHRTAVEAITAVGGFGLFERTVQDDAVQWPDAAEPVELASWRTDPRSKLPLLMTVETIGNVTVAYQKPSRARRVLLLFHGCGHDAEHFFQLPEERIVVRKALTEHYITVAFSSKDRRSRCWDTEWPPEQNEDIKAVVAAFAAFSARERLGSMPVFALGASSGGQFVTVLAHSMQLAGIVVQVAPGLEEAINTPAAAGRHVAFVHMTNDRNWASPVVIDESAGMLKKSGASVVSFSCAPKIMTDTVLADRIDDFTPSLSAKVFGMLKDAGVVDWRGVITDDPRSGLALSRLQFPDDDAGRALGDVVLLYTPALQEELNVLYSAHEFTSEYFDDLLRWFDDVLKASS
eukprot:TRINITY_DN6087_c0_g1_i1.p1 TRINITY_DN6087_c0_g1~~TRINITY_DN6087_c0_g1_i1.p1  ORF type:complete len:408 (-),score=139.11 TRINITY_DN6087_c0_g1_i1:550-1773(-)